LDEGEQHRGEARLTREDEKKEGGRRMRGRRMRSEAADIERFDLL
jgi:hypothetical protein